MRAFGVALRALVGYYNDLFALTALSFWWWVTGGIFVGVAAAAGLVMFVSGGPWWLAPVAAIPAGPATLALTAAVRQTTRGRTADRRDYFEALRANWKPGLVLNAIGMGLLALLLLNLIFYLFQENTVLRLFAVVWAYLAVAWISIQLYVYSFYLAQDQPRVGLSIRLAALGVFANPLFSLLLLVLALVLTAISIVLPVLVILSWPAVMALLGDYALRLMLERAGVEEPE